MALIIDGHNLIGAMPDIHLNEPEDEARLLARLRAYRSFSGQELVVFFDSGDMPAPAGRAPNLSSPGVAVRFSRPGQTADDAIVAFLQGRPQPGQYAVVTNDVELIWRVQSAGASIIRANEFVTKLARPAAHSRRPAQEPAPDPRDPAFADLYVGFLAAERARSGTRRADTLPFETYVERLYGDDVDAAQKAAQWLGRSRRSAALTPLRDALTHSDVRVRAAALLALGDLGAPVAAAAVPDLCDRLAHDPGSMAREAAAQSLGLLGDRSVEAALETASKTDAKSKVRKAAQAALAQVKARKR